MINTVISFGFAFTVSYFTHEKVENLMVEASIYRYLCMVLINLTNALVLLIIVRFNKTELKLKKWTDIVAFLIIPIMSVLIIYSCVYISILTKLQPEVVGLLTFICLSMAVTMLAIGAILPLIKNDRSFNVFSGILNLLSMLLILIAAISILFVPTDWSYFSDVTWNDNIRFGLGGGYIATTIISFFAAILCLPSIISCLKR